MADNATGFEIRGRLYPMPEGFRLCDPVLVEELTGLPFNTFAERLDEMGDSIRDGGEAEVDPVMLPGLIGVSVWQAHKTWARAKVIKWVQNVDIDEVDFKGGDSDDAEGEARPPDESSSTSSSSSTKPQAEELVQAE
jgi:hypothetical protein